MADRDRKTLRPASLRGVAKVMDRRADFRLDGSKQAVVQGLRKHHARRYGLSAPGQDPAYAPPPRSAKVLPRMKDVTDGLSEISSNHSTLMLTRLEIVNYFNVDNAFRLRTLREIGIAFGFT